MYANLVGAVFWEVEIFGGAVSDFVTARVAFSKKGNSVELLFSMHVCSGERLGVHVMLPFTIPNQHTSCS